jgi:carbamate kinase
LNRRVVVAFGGNALIRHGEDGTLREQQRNAARLARSLVPLLRRWQVVLVHGNGPQVGNLLLRVEESITKVPPVTLDLCVAQSQGEIGALLEIALRNRLRAVNLEKPVVTLLTHARVDADDPAFGLATKPIGPFLSRYRAGLMRRERKGAVVEDAGRGFRQVVASPRPVEILELEAIRRLLADGNVVIAAGGGGIPVVEAGRRQLGGVEAVIDKDYTAGLLARDLGAERLAILTDVDQVYLHYGRKHQRPLPRLTVGDARRFLAGGHFPPGSMGPKVETAASFVERSGGEALITRPDLLHAALRGRAGTRIVLDPADGPSRRRIRKGRHAR